MLVYCLVLLFFFFKMFQQKNNEEFVHHKSFKLEVRLLKVKTVFSMSISELSDGEAFTYVNFCLTILKK